MNKLQLFVLLQDTVAHIKHGSHLAPNYGYVKGQVLNMFGKKRATSKQLLVYIGHVYIEVLEDRQQFEDYVIKWGVADIYDEELIKMTPDVEV
jgi:hypothetical protein